jgi:hypothetical protein
VMPCVDARLDVTLGSVGLRGPHHSPPHLLPTLLVLVLAIRRRARRR